LQEEKEKWLDSWMTKREFIKKKFYKQDSEKKLHKRKGKLKN
jgi:hypothetical protein